VYCVSCDEVMELAMPLELVDDYAAGGSPRIALVGWAVAHPALPVWACYSCGDWLPTL
jgi:hypothetical protein